MGRGSMSLKGSKIMALNITALDQELELLEKRTQMIQEIKRLAADPEAKALLERLMQNGTAPNGTAPATEAQIPIIRIGNEYRGLSQIDSVRRAITKHHGQRFVVGQIGDELRQGGIAITNIAVGRVLLRLQKAEELRVALEGGGNVPNQYEATAEFGTV